MKIQLCVFGNRHAWYRNLLVLLYHALSDLGHVVTVADEAVDPTALNIFVQPTLIDHPGLVQALADNHIRYVIVGSEVIAHLPKRVAENPGLEKSYREFFARALAVWPLMKSDAEFAKGIHPNVFWLRYGFHAKAEEIRLPEERPIDVFMFGNAIYPTRARIIAALREAGLGVEVQEASGPSLIRNSLVGAAKINLNIPEPTVYAHVNPMRTVYLANNRIQCVSTPSPDADGYLKPAWVVEEGALLATLKHKLGARSWVKDGEEAYAIAAQDPMVPILAEAMATLA